MGFLSGIFGSTSKSEKIAVEDVTVGMALADIDHIIRRAKLRERVRASDNLSLSEAARAALKAVEDPIRETYALEPTPRWGMPGRTTIDIGHDDTVVGVGWFPEVLSTHTPSEAGAILAQLEAVLGPGELDEDATDDDKSWVWVSDGVQRLFAYTWDDINENAEIMYSESLRPARSAT